VCGVFVVKATGNMGNGTVLWFEFILITTVFTGQYYCLLCGAYLVTAAVDIV